MLARPITRFLLLVLVCLLGVSYAPVARAADPVPKDLDAAVAKAHPLLEKVRAAPQGGKEAKALLKEVFACLGPFEKCYVLEGWVKRKRGYITDVVRAAGWRLLLDVPLSDTIDWEWEKSDQLQAEFTISLPDEKPRKVLQLWVYEWDTTYSGVGGENAGKLARVIFDSDKYFAKSNDRKASSKVVTKRLNRHFTRSYHYWNADFDKKHEAEVRHNHWYVKGKDVTYTFEVIGYARWEKTYDAYHTWLLESDGPLVQAILASVRPNEAYYKPKKK